MTIDILHPSRDPSEVCGPRILLTGDDGGNWTMSVPPTGGVRQFSSFDAALNSADHLPGSGEATVEVWRGGEYICCLPPEQRQCHEVSIHAPMAVRGHLFAIAERHANRVAELMFAVLGPLLWLSLAAMAVIASLGWRVFLL
jgi:hypothetical protein